MRPALTLLTLLPYLGMTFANTCRAAGTSAVATASGDALGTRIWINLLATSNTAAGGGASTDHAVSVSSGGIDASATDSSVAHATSAAASVSSGDHSSASGSVTLGVSFVQTAPYPEGSQMGTDLVLSNPSDDCKCGYSISSLNGEYFPYKFSYTFSALSDGDAKDGLAAAGWVVNDGKGVSNGGVIERGGWDLSGFLRQLIPMVSGTVTGPLTEISTTRYYNGVKQDSPTENQPEHTMIFTINNWSNGGTGWTHGPPTGEDSNLRVKSVLLYYRTQDVRDMAALDSSCTDSDVCKV
ncbi:hypothetical protein I307_04347 [Cryptococcus deuterogattii 99/473]|uniref:GH16 domain-containing protein n=1 Tax=Cryptococcus deuterogattii Ram5 TaxID=1296110 RepID=A0A0D0TZ90_9TREE|nr:hypothetical protein I313_02392 [Cryptococcus deuterogattii Ram5]KIY56243.1 hypothetical protein I307_04347 [Cryptococcus deuterogattii 99/473]